MKTICLELPEGSLDGYVANASEVFIGNYLESQKIDASRVMPILIESGERTALLKTLYVIDEYRGEGIGASLMGYFIDAASDCTSMMLICDQHETQAEGFDLAEWYESLGFICAFETSSGPLMVYPKELALRLAAYQVQQDEAELAA